MRALVRTLDDWNSRWEGRQRIRAALDKFNSSEGAEREEARRELHQLSRRLYWGLDRKAVYADPKGTLVTDQKITRHSAVFKDDSRLWQRTFVKQPNQSFNQEQQTDHVIEALQYYPELLVATLIALRPLEVTDENSAWVKKQLATVDRLTRTGHLQATNFADFDARHFRFWFKKRRTRNAIIHAFNVGLQKEVDLSVFTPNPEGYLTEQFFLQLLKHNKTFALVALEYDGYLGYAQLDQGKHQQAPATTPTLMQQCVRRGLVNAEALEAFHEKHTQSNAPSAAATTTTTTTTTTRHGGGGASAETASLLDGANAHDDGVPRVVRRKNNRTNRVHTNRVRTTYQRMRQSVANFFHWLRSEPLPARESLIRDIQTMRENLSAQVTAEARRVAQAAAARAQLAEQNQQLRAENEDLASRLSKAEAALATAQRDHGAANRALLEQVSNKQADAARVQGMYEEQARTIERLSREKDRLYELLAGRSHVASPTHQITVGSGGGAATTIAPVPGAAAISAPMAIRAAATRDDDDASAGVSASMPQHQSFNNFAKFASDTTATTPTSSPRRPGDGGVATHSDRRNLNLGTPVQQFAQPPATPGSASTTASEPPVGSPPRDGRNGGGGFFNRFRGGRGGSRSVSAPASPAKLASANR